MYKIAALQIILYNKYKIKKHIIYLSHTQFIVATLRLFVNH